LPSPVLLSLELLQLGHGLAALGIEAKDLVDRCRLPLLARALLDEVGVLADEVKAQHVGPASWGTG
jgi:hypothetical protein